jgi:ribosomal protein S18 acetylase RimI-like enzyme
MTGAGLRIRAARTADLDAIARIHTAGRSAYYRGAVPEDVLADPEAAARRRRILSHRMHDSRCTVLCAEAAGQLAGFAVLGPPLDQPSPDPHAGELRQIHVSPAFWRQGIGSALHHSCVQAWRAASVSTGQVDVWANNQRARAFYAHHGWQPTIGRRPGPAGFDYLRLRLTIPG